MWALKHTWAVPIIVSILALGLFPLDAFAVDPPFFSLKWGSDGSGDGQFSLTESVEVDSDGNVYVADGNNNRIQKFDSAGTFQGWFGKCMMFQTKKV